MEEFQSSSSMSAGAPACIYKQAAILRKNQTPAEQKLWLILRKKPGGFKFRRQHPFQLYILDFYCHAKRLAIEIDGSVHLLSEVDDNDEERETEIRKLGVEIIRFTNEQVLNNTLEVIRQILLVLESRRI